MDAIELTWQPAPGHEKETVDALKSAGAPLRTGLGFEPITVISTALAVTALVRALVELYRDARYMGVLIDATGERVQVREMPGWPRKQVLVLTDGGPQFYRPEAEEAAADSLAKIADLLRDR